ncbi:MAG: hypothetical protein JWP89_416 [Schlesneria sp.]|nr:hypothetical protein [Schlesneria sp.]
MKTPHSSTIIISSGQVANSRIFGPLFKSARKVACRLVPTGHFSPLHDSRQTQNATGKFELLLHHFYHISTLFSTIAAGLGTRCHLLVVGDFLTRGCTIFATFRTTFRANGGEFALASAERCTHLAAFGAVHAKMHALGMFLFAVNYQHRTVMEARVAHDLAISADGGAFQHMGRVRAIGCENRGADDEQCDCHRLREHSVIHIQSLSVGKLADRLQRQHTTAFLGLTPGIRLNRPLASCRIVTLVQAQVTHAKNRDDRIRFW